jgi:hypothetical protein
LIIEQPSEQKENTQKTSEDLSQEIDKNIHSEIPQIQSSSKEMKKFEDELQLSQNLSSSLEVKEQAKVLDNSKNNAKNVHDSPSKEMSPSTIPKTKNEKNAQIPKSKKAEKVEPTAKTFLHSHSLAKPKSPSSHKVQKSIEIKGKKQESPSSSNRIQYKKHGSSLILHMTVDQLAQKPTNRSNSKKSENKKDKIPLINISSPKSIVPSSKTNKTHTNSGLNKQTDKKHTEKTSEKKKCHCEIEEKGKKDENNKDAVKLRASNPLRNKAKENKNSLKEAVNTSKIEKCEESAKKNVDKVGLTNPDSKDSSQAKNENTLKIDVSPSRNKNNKAETDSEGECVNLGIKEERKKNKRKNNNNREEQTQLSLPQNTKSVSSNSQSQTNRSDLNKHKTTTNPPSSSKPIILSAASVASKQSQNIHTNTLSQTNKPHNNSLSHPPQNYTNNNNNNVVSNSVILPLFSKPAELQEVKSNFDSNEDNNQFVKQNQITQIRSLNHTHQEDCEDQDNNIEDIDDIVIHKSPEHVQPTIVDRMYDFQINNQQNNLDASIPSPKFQTYDNSVDDQSGNYFYKAQNVKSNQGSRNHDDSIHKTNPSENNVDKRSSQNCYTFSKDLIFSQTVRDLGKGIAFKKKMKKRLTSRDRRNFASLKESRKNFVLKMNLDQKADVRKIYNQAHYTRSNSKKSYQISPIFVKKGTHQSAASTDSTHISMNSKYGPNQIVLNQTNAFHQNHCVKLKYPKKFSLHMHNSSQGEVEIKQTQFQYNKFDPTQNIPSQRDNQSQSISHSATPSFDCK